MPSQWILNELIKNEINTRAQSFQQDIATRWSFLVAWPVSALDVVTDQYINLICDAKTSKHACVEVEYPIEFLYLDSTQS